MDCNGHTLEEEEEGRLEVIVAVGGLGGLREVVLALRAGLPDVVAMELDLEEVEVSVTRMVLGCRDGSELACQAGPSLEKMAHGVVMGLHPD